MREIYNLYFSLVANTLSTVDNKRRCWRTVGGVLVEKDAETVKKDLDLQIVNIKQTLEIVQKTLKTQEQTIKEMERAYSNILQPQKSQNQTQTTQENKGKGGVLA